MDLQAAPRGLKSFLEKQKSDFLDNPSFRALEKTICDKVDEVVLEIWRGVPRLTSRGFALFAIGGYGRGGLHPESDLDLLLFFQDRVVEEVVKAALNPLWDLPFRVGHQIREA